MPKDVVSREEWLEWEEAALREAVSFQHLVEIAIGVLQFLHLKHGTEIIQICGPMTTGGLGQQEANMQVFGLAVRRAKENGLAVFNQIPFQDAVTRIVNKQQQGKKHHKVGLLHRHSRGLLSAGFLIRLYPGSVLLAKLENFHRCSLGT